MENSEFLLAIAEIAIALITFAAIVLVLRQLVGRQLSAFHLLVLKLFAICGFETVFFALLPFLLNFLGLQTQVLWQVSSTLFFIGITVTTIWYWRCRQKVAPGRRQNWSTISVTIVLAIAVWRRSTRRLEHWQQAARAGTDLPGISAMNERA